MSKRIDFTLSETELETIVEAISYSQYKEVRPRATALHMLHMGQVVTEVAKVMNVTKVTIYDWFHAFKESDVAGLRDKEGRGRRRKATDEYVALLKDALEKYPPSYYGYEFSIWSIATLSAHLEEATGIHLSERSFYDLLAAEGYVYRRPKYSLQHLQDAEAVAAAREQLGELKRGRVNQEKTENPTISWSLWTKQPSL